jgi:hypothetical protein
MMNNHYWFQEVSTLCCQILFAIVVWFDIDRECVLLVCLFCHFVIIYFHPGVDTNVMVYSTAKYGCSDPRKIPAYPMVVTLATFLQLFHMNWNLSDHLFLH